MKPEVTFEDFQKLDIRSGKVIAAELIPKSKKLIKLEVSFGEFIGNRTILAGLSPTYDVESIVGQNVVAIINFPPREMMGFQSHGMLLAAESVGEKRLRLVQCDVEPGSEIG